jgi:hypothetical protein
MKLRIFGLRLSRLREFRYVLTYEGMNKGFVSVIKNVALAAWSLWRDRDIEPTSEEVRERYKFCMSCPAHRVERVYDNKQGRFVDVRQCGGCGCYTPFKVLQADECWGWKFGTGWRKSKRFELDSQDTGSKV